MTPLVEHFDHFVVPVDDIMIAEDFYINVLGCRLATNRDGKPMRFGLNVLHIKHGMRPHTFFVAAGKRIGAYLQTDFRPPFDGVRGAQTYSFETTEAGLAQFADTLRKAGVKHEGPVAENDGIARSALYFNDPAGNHFAVYVPVKPNATSDHPRDMASPLTAVGYIALEAPDLEKSVRFYVDAFGLPEPQRRKDPRSGADQAIVAMPSGQAIILTQAPFAPKGLKLSRLETGPHLAFYVPAARWDEMMARLAKHDIPNGDRAAEAKGRVTADLDTYIDEPGGHVIQLISALQPA